MKLHLFSPSPLGMMIKVKEVESSTLPPTYHLPIVEPIKSFIVKTEGVGPTTNTKMATFTLSRFEGEHGFYVLNSES